MAQGGFDDYEMHEREEQEEEELEEQREQEEQENINETSFIDNDDGVVLKPHGRPRVRIQVDNISDRIPNVGKDIGTIKRSITNDVKKYFKNVFKVNVNKKNGPNSSKILDYTKFITETSGTTFIDYKGKRVGKIGKNLEPEPYTRKNKAFVDEFKLDLDNTFKEYKKTPLALVEESFGSNVPENVVDDILKGSTNKIEETIRDVNESVEGNSESLTEQDIREFTGVFDPKGVVNQTKINALEIQADHWKESAKNTVNEKTEKLYKAMEKATRLQADNIRLQLGERPIHDETLEIIKNETNENDLGKLEKFKEFAKRNIVGLSAVAITIAGVITTIVVAAKNAVKKGANFTKKLAKKIYELGKKLGPLLAPILNVLGKIVEMGARGLGWLAGNLWVLAIALAWFLYDMYKT